MTHKISTVNARIELDLKIEAETILHHVGLSAAEAVRLFYKQVCLHQGLPFDVRIPNAKTLKAIQDADCGKAHKIKNVAQLFKNKNCWYSN